MTPTDTIKLDYDKVKGFVTEVGGPTSHSAIIARSLGIPAINCVDSLEHIKQGDCLAIDGEEGTCSINGSEEVIEAFTLKLYRQIENEKQTLINASIEPISQDGHLVEVVANIVTPKIVDAVNTYGGMGIGLYRSEFLFMETSKAPSEDKQFAAYKSVVVAMDGKEVVVRTLDVGGDKEIAYLNIDKEDNPFMGLRAIRYCLKNKPLFKTQIRALLRASHYGKLSIMLPMISCVEELLEAKLVIEECKNDLSRSMIPYDDKVQVGIMIELPSAAIMSDTLAKESDFFSIGTNDLIGYTMGVDRMNTNVGHLYSEHQPSVLRLIALTIENGHKHNIKVSMCGNSAANPELIPVYLGMGLDKFSVNPTEIPDVKKANQ